MFSENLTEYMGKPVVNWDASEGLADPGGTAYRVGLSWEEDEQGLSWIDRFAAFLEAPGVSEITVLVIGGWDGMYEQEGDTSPVIEAVVSAHERLPHLTGLFVGDITYEECEVSWLQQSDLSPLFDAFPLLEQLSIRGGVSLSLGRIRHERLKSLVIQSGGLPASVVQELGEADLPALEHLELWLGAENYGGDSTVEDLAPILSGDLYPKLSYLGLRDSEIADQIAIALKDAPIVERIQTLDLSEGTLGDEGAAALLENPAIARLKRLDLHHHYCTPEMMARLEALGIDIDLSEREDEGQYGRYVAVGE